MASITCGDYGIFVDTQSTSFYKMGMYRLIAGCGAGPGEPAEGLHKAFLVGSNRYLWLQHPNATAAVDTYAARAPVKASADSITVSDAEKTLMDALIADAPDGLAGFRGSNDMSNAMYEYVKNNRRPEGDI